MLHAPNLLFLRDGEKELLQPEAHRQFVASNCNWFLDIVQQCGAVA